MSAKKPTKVEVKNTSKKVVGKPPAPMPTAPEKAEIPKTVIETDEEIEVPYGYILTEEGIYSAIRRCYFGIKLYKEGEPYYSPGKELIPHHFEKAVKSSKEEIE